MLSKATIQKLKRILKEEYNRDIDFKEASEIAHTLVNYFDLLAKVYHRNQLKDENHNKQGSRKK